jgi:hypothetical protein
MIHTCTENFALLSSKELVAERVSIAFSLCAEYVQRHERGRALFISEKSVAESLVPSVVDYGGNSSNKPFFHPISLQRIDMKYASDGLSLRKTLGSLHLWPEPPNFIVINNLSSILSDPLGKANRSESVLIERVAHVLGLVADTVSYLSRVKASRCQVVFSDECTQDAYLQLLARFGNGSYSYNLKLAQDGSFTLHSDTAEQQRFQRIGNILSLMQQ